ncbi:biotin transporter BioY [Parvimonas sp. D2]|uniref:biotin transporter BioY n=1 Tax=unclassified Parvimonas TaxID=1151464 RepID=UPI00020DDF4C|nr:MULTISPECIES: biotin transporter BioY [unclassified Parvimonas]EGL35437.1 BioY family protein [Parvimonas sp. oral taxon 110 str. F0139]MBF1294760.1 biotin transporter BioY [Parvimonas sp.]MEB3012231.1 biotin transporter BioY [Parvimonas sp. D2]MEB3087824.1 biotin transporter BioY [Parvimonas sp. D4]
MKISTKELNLVALFSALIAVGAFIKIPFLLVPITLQTLFVVLSALVLERRLAVLSVIVYIMIGLVGFPIFANGGGINYIFSPTFGYLLAFIFATYFISSFKEKNIYISTAIGMLIIYFFGMIYFIFIQYVLNGKVYLFSYLFYNLFLVFLPGDILSCVVAIIGYRKILRLKK